MVCRIGAGECSIYSGRGVLRGFTVAFMATALWAAKGQGEDGVLFRASWRSSWWSWRGWAVPNTVGGSRWSARPWRLSAPSPAMAGCGRGHKRVRDVRGAVAKRKGAGRR